MKIAFRVDASSEVGTGHVMRCLTLANELRTLGAASFFICRKKPGDLIEHIKKQGYHVYEISGESDAWKYEVDQVIQILEKQSDIDWIVVDHYGLDAQWEKIVRPFVHKVMVIDDLADRPHDCDLLLDQNLYQNMNLRYTGLVPVSAKLFLGPSHMLLREEFLSTSKKEEWDGRIEQILVSFGGTDPMNETTKVLRAIEMLDQKPNVDVVIGKSSPNLEEICDYCQDKTWTKVHIQTKEMAKLMAAADLAIGAGGSTVWERFYMRLPSLVIETASNQKEIITFLQEKGAIVYLGHSVAVSDKDIFLQLKKVLDDKPYIMGFWQSMNEIWKDHQPYGVSKYMMGGEHHE